MDQCGILTHIMVKVPMVVLVALLILFVLMERNMNTIADFEYNRLWRKIITEYHFDSRAVRDHSEWLNLSFDFDKYILPVKCWDDDQERRVNQIFKLITDGMMYAMDWQHDSFEYSPSEDIALGYTFFDEDSKLYRYFPSYYPNGDYHFFVDVDWRFGLLGNPFNNELIIFGKDLMRNFKMNSDYLQITKAN